MNEPSSSPRELAHSRFATCYRVAGQLMIVVGVVMLGLSKWGTHRGPGVSVQGGLVAYGLSICCFLLGVRVNHYGRKLQLLRTAPAVTEDVRPTVLYLRPFTMDAALLQVPGNHPEPTARTEEEQMVAVLAEVGPVVAIGEPGEQLPQLGASRIYVGHDSWQEMVREHIEKARLVVLAAGTSAGVMWELRTAVELLRPAQLWILVPTKLQLYEAFRSAASTHLPKPLPHAQEVFGRLGYLMKRYSSMRGVLYFDESWTPKYAPMIMSLKVWRQHPADRGMLMPAYRSAFELAFANMGIPIAPRRFNWIVTLLLLGIMTGVVWLQWVLGMYSAH